MKVKRKKYNVGGKVEGNKKTPSKDKILEMQEKGYVWLPDQQQFAKLFKGKK
jgi:hypothetical protein